MIKTSEEEIKKAEEDLKAFTAKFEEVSMTLIAKMAEINDKLSRVTASVEMVDKLRIQNAENKQVMSNVESGIKNLTRRLEKMANDGFKIPDATTIEQRAAIKEAGGLSSPIISNLEPIDDLSDLGEPPSMEEIEKQLSKEGIDLKKEPIIEPKEKQIKEPITTSQPKVGPKSTIESPKPSLAPSSKPLFNTEDIPELKPMPKFDSIPKQKADIKTEKQEFNQINPPVLDNGLPPLPPPPAKPVSSGNITSSIQPIQSASGIPKSNLARIENPKTPKDILINLIADIEEANLESHVGGLILKAKDILSKQIPFHTAYFEMIMAGGKLKNSNKPNSPGLVEEIKNKIKDWSSKF